MKTKTSTKDLGLSSNERLSIENPSPFTPKTIKNFIPKGLKCYCFHSGFKTQKKDLLVIIFENKVNVEVIYSLTSTPSAPIIWDKKNNNGKCKAVIINSGNANAHTGKQGIKIIEKYVTYLAKHFNISKNLILVSSTGVIGEMFNPSLIINSISKINKSKPSNLKEAAESIMTTDTYAKTSINKIKIQNKHINIFGFAKGSGMIHPNMGTMLAYIFVECELNNRELKKLVRLNLNDTFNSISVDSDTSTSDTFMMFSLKNIKINLNNKKNYELLSRGVFKVMKDLSQQIIKDGEGVSKIIEVNVIKAKTELQATKIAFSIVNSPLVKTAVAGEDANWGRILMAIGKTFEKINQEKIEIRIGEHILSKNGKAYNKINIKKINKYMKNNNIKIRVNLNIGKFSRIVFGNDLTHEYIRINADYRS